MYDTGVGQDMHEAYLRQKEYSNRYLNPAIEALKARSKSTSIVDGAAERAEGLGDTLTATQDRMRSRFEGGQNNYADMARGFSNEQNVASGRAAIMDQAYQEQDADQMGARRALMGQFGQQQSMALNGFNTTNNMQEERHNAYDAAKEADKAKTKGLVGSVVGGIAGSFIGMPAIGASLGAGIAGL